MSRAIDKPQEQSYMKVGFTFGSETERYTDWTEDLPGGYLSTPGMSVELPENAGTLEDTHAQLKMPLDPFLDAITAGDPHVPILVEIEEAIVDAVGSGSATILRHFAGRVERAVRNPKRKSGLVVLEAKLAKATLEIPMGVPCNHQCPWSVYGPGCGLVRSAFQFFPRITSIDGFEVTVNADPGKVDRWFRRGTMLRNGLYVTVRDWRASDPTKFIMARRPPMSWEGEEVFIYAGCDGTIEKCRQLGNENQFGGIGFAIPAWNPNFEDRPGG